MHMCISGYLVSLMEIWSQYQIYLRECAIVPRVPLMRKDVGDVAQPIVADIPPDRREEFIFADLDTRQFIQHDFVSLMSCFLVALLCMHADDRRSS